MNPAIVIHPLWMARLREKRVSYIHVPGVSSAQRGDIITLEVVSNLDTEQPPARVSAEVTDATVITWPNQDDEDVVVCTIVSVQLRD